MSTPARASLGNLLRWGGTAATLGLMFYLLAQHQRVNLRATNPKPNSNFESEYREAYAQLRWFNCPAFPVSGQAV